MAKTINAIDKIQRMGIAVSSDAVANRGSEIFRGGGPCDGLLDCWKRGGEP
jgi:hypothetical protein